MKPILLLILFAAVSLTSCTQTRRFRDGETAVAQELRSPETARYFCTVDEAQFFGRNGAHVVRLWVDNRNLAGLLIPQYTHFEVTIDPDEPLGERGDVSECAAEMKHRS